MSVRSHKELLAIVDGLIKPYCEDALGCALRDEHVIEALLAELDNHRRRFIHEKIPTKPREISALLEALYARAEPEVAVVKLSEKDLTTLAALKEAGAEGQGGLYDFMAPPAGEPVIAEVKKAKHVKKAKV